MLFDNGLWITSAGVAVTILALAFVVGVVFAVAVYTSTDM